MKISKEVLKKHNKALEILSKNELSFDDKLFVLENYHEGAGKMNNLISAHFTPQSIAQGVQLSVINNNFVDLCAGIGILSWNILRVLNFENDKDFVGICIENCKEYYDIGKKLMPELHWINGDIFDPKIISEVKHLMIGRNFSIVSNPPYGKVVKTDTNSLLKYRGSDFEYKAIELGYLLGANDGVFLIPQESCNFKMSGNHVRGSVYNEKSSSKYNKFEKETGLKMSANMGLSTDIHEGGKGWKDVSIVTEISIFDYDVLRDELEGSDQLELF